MKTPRLLFCRCVPGTAGHHAHQECHVIERWTAVIPGTQDGTCGVIWHEPGGGLAQAALAFEDGALPHTDPALADIPLHVLTCLWDHVTLCLDLARVSPQPCPLCHAPLLHRWCRWCATRWEPLDG
jgi:hypothetical protein